MRISIITAVYNRAATIEATIQSVLRQRQADIEYILVDGNSTDGTGDVIRCYESRVARYIREADTGIYNALNKGIRAASGEIVGFVHADDSLVGDDILSKVASAFHHPEVDASYGDLIYVDPARPHRIVRYWKAGPISPTSFRWGWMPPHPTFYLRRTHYLKLGCYREEFEIAADYELMLRMLHKHELKTAYIEEVMIRMQLGGKSNASWLNHLRANQEDKQAWRVNGLSPPRGLRLMKPFRKLQQFWTRPPVLAPK